jgi:hypothetical protein
MCVHHFVNTLLHGDIANDTKWDTCLFYLQDVPCNFSAERLGPQLMELIILGDRPSRSYHIRETLISLDSGIKRYAITFLGIF